MSNREERIDELAAVYEQRLAELGPVAKLAPLLPELVEAVIRAEGVLSGYEEMRHALLDVWEQLKQAHSLIDRFQRENALLKNLAQRYEALVEGQRTVIHLLEAQERRSPPSRSRRVKQR